LITLGLPQKSSKKIIGQFSIFPLIPTYLKKKRASGTLMFIGVPTILKIKIIMIFDKIKI